MTASDIILHGQIYTLLNFSVFFLFGILKVNEAKTRYTGLIVHIEETVNAYKILEA